FICAVVVAAGETPLNAHEAQNTIPLAIEGDYQRIAEALQPQHRLRDPQHGLLGADQRQRLGHHLAKHDVQIGQHADGHHASDGVHADPLRQADRFQERSQPPSQGLLAVQAKRQAGESDAELGGGDIAVLSQRVLDDRQHALGALLAILGAALDGGPWCADDGELGGDEQAVERDQRKYHQGRYQPAHAHRPSASEAASAMGVTSTDSMAGPSMRSISMSMPSISNRSPVEGIRSSAVMMNPATVLASLVQAWPVAAMASSSRMIPGSRSRPPGSGSACGPSLLYSSATPPTSTDSTSSRVTRPRIEPYSSMTMSLRTPRSRMTASRRSPVTFSRTTTSGRMISRGVGSLPVATKWVAMSLVCSIPMGRWSDPV